MTGQLSAVEAGGMFAALVRDRDGLAPASERRSPVPHDWEKGASVELRAGSADAIDAYAGARADQRRETGTRCSTPSIAAWKEDTACRPDEPDDRRRPGQRQRAQRPGPGRPDRRRTGRSTTASDVAGGGTAGVGDQVVTRQNDRRL